MVEDLASPLDLFWYIKVSPRILSARPKLVSNMKTNEWNPPKIWKNPENWLLVKFPSGKKL